MTQENLPQEMPAVAIESSLKQLMRINAQMLEGTIRVLGQQNMAMHQQVSELAAVNARLLRELAEAIELIANLTHK